MLPLLILFVATVIGGWLNTVDLRGRVIDDFTDQGIINAALTHGQRVVSTDVNGSFEFLNLPRQSRMRVDANAYLRTSVPTSQDQIRMTPTSWSALIVESGTETPVDKADIRQGTTVLATSTTAVNTIVAPHPGRGAKVLVCAPGYESKEVDVVGVLQKVELGRGGSGCPPLPSPSPSPSPSPTGSPAPSPTPSPSPSPS
ncbi:MAG TPA: hypothetical protein VJP45_15395 [Candidatus Limnocylindria bacterium]|nr:hypothetical protein [Candidatus Limnocylindria bacterium]